MGIARAFGVIATATAARRTMSAPAIVDRPRLCRLFLFIREHEEQARAAEDEVRAFKWERVLNKLLEHCPRAAA